MADPKAICVKKWNDGVMEYWSDAWKEIAEDDDLSPCFKTQYSNTPLLQYSSSIIFTAHRFAVVPP
jgi:hypothetical protein